MVWNNIKSEQMRILTIKISYQTARLVFDVLTFERKKAEMFD